MTDVLTNILQWLIPSGGLGAVIAWMVSSRVRNTRAAKEVHDTYKTMYEDVHRSIIDLRSENERLHKAIIRLERAIRSAIHCPHYSNCPVRIELSGAQEQPVGKRKRKRKGQPIDTDTSNTDDPDTGTGGSSEHSGPEPC